MISILFYNNNDPGSLEDNQEILETCDRMFLFVII